jgi:hypothetical protein
LLPRSANRYLSIPASEDRDAQRIHVAKDVAGLSQIDHWHHDALASRSCWWCDVVSELIPVKNYYDHGLPTAPAADIDPKLVDAYRTVSAGKSIALNAGDEIRILGDRSAPRLRFRILAANATVVGEEKGAPQIMQCGADFKPIEEDKTDNAKSLSMLLTYGSFRFFDGGDLTWNVENKLVCPKDLVGPVDLFQVNQHGTSASNNPALVRVLKPRVAVIDNGPRKGADPKVFATLKTVPEIEAIYQLHKNVLSSWNHNTASLTLRTMMKSARASLLKFR